MKAITIKNKNYLLAGICLVLVLLCWQLAFKKTFAAVALNHELELKDQDKSAMAYNPNYLEQKHKVLGQLLSRYTVDSVAWKNDFWLAISRISELNRVNVEYNPGKLKLLGDSSDVTARQNISFEGDYGNLVRLLDSLEKTKGIGLISSLGFRTKKKQGFDALQKLYLDCSISVIK